MLQLNASELNIPIFMSETGCNTPKPRTFDDQTALLGEEMSDWSGAIIYEWIQEQNDYGLISYGEPADPTATGGNVVAGFTRAGTPTPISPDFENLSNHWKTLNPTGVSMDAYSPSNSPPPCPAFTEGMWVVSENAALPTVGAKLASDATVYSSAPAPTGGAGSSTSEQTSSSSAAAPPQATSFIHKVHTSDRVAVKFKGTNFLRWWTTQTCIVQCVTMGLAVIMALLCGL